MPHWRYSAAERVVLDLTTGAVRDGVLEIDPVALGNPEQVGGLSLIHI